jgi:hypothetical protein
LAPTLVIVCGGLIFSLLAWSQWRLQRQSDEQPLDGTYHERLLRGLLLLGGVMLGLFIIYALFGIP